MNRRAFLRQCGLAGSLSAAGCLDFTTTSPSGRQEAAQSANSSTGEQSRVTTVQPTTTTSLPDVEGGMFQYNAANTGSHPTSTGPKHATQTDWTFESDEFGAKLTSPVIHDGRLFVGAETGNLYAVDVSGGELLWTYEAEESITEAPAVSGETVFVGSADNTLYALNAERGTTEWTFTARSDITTAPTVANGIVYIGSEDQHLYAVAADTGDLEWRQKVEAGIRSVPAVADGQVVFQSGLRIYALSASSGELHWEKYINTRALGATIYDGIAYIPTGNGGHEQYVLTFDIDTGNERWRIELNGGGSHAIPATDGTLLYVCDGEGRLYAFNLDTGKQVWTATTDEQTNSSPLVIDDVVYLTTLHGFYGFRASDGEQLFQTDEVEAFTQTPVVLDGTAYVADNGRITALTD